MRSLTSVILILSIVVSGCVGSASEPEKYYDSTNRSHYIVLYPDGTYLVEQGKDSFGGEYKKEGGALYLINIFGAIKLDIVDERTLVDKYNDRWTR